jgi:hypothetical protein
MTFLTLLCALALSGIAAYYSIIGLAAIFTGAFWPIVFMGSVLEASKLVTTSWLYRNWKTCPFLLKTYLTTAVVILMLITSMGIFGFLSKAHIDSTLDSGANMVEVKTLNAQEQLEAQDFRIGAFYIPTWFWMRLQQGTSTKSTCFTDTKVPRHAEAMLLLY